MYVHVILTVRYEDWFWKVALGKCYLRLGMLRDAEAQFKSAIKQQPMIATFLQLGKIYLRLDQVAKYLIEIKNILTNLITAAGRAGGVQNRPRHFC